MQKQVVAYGLIIVIILWVVYMLMKRIGLVQSKEEKKTDLEKSKNIRDLKDSEYFDTDLYKSSNYGYAHLLNSAKANEYAKSIKDSFGWFNDDEVRIYAIFRALDNKIEISQVADAYFQLYGSDLLGDLVNYLNENELDFLWGIIKKKSNA